MKHIILQKDEKKVIGVMLGGNSLRHSKLREESNSLRSFVESDSTQDDRNGGQDDKRIDIVLAGENSSVEVWGLLLAKGQSKTAFDVFITHAAPMTKSRVIVKSVLKNRSTFAFRGTVKIEKGAKGADAYLRSDALLFDGAKMGDDTPALEILERDVKAGHAATVGKVDEQMLFYLMSRGIGRVQAEKMLVEGFVKPIWEKLRKPAGSYFDTSGSFRTRVKERSLVGDNGGTIVKN